MNNNKTKQLVCIGNIEEPEDRTFLYSLTEEQINLLRELHKKEFLDLNTFYVVFADEKIHEIP